MHQRAVIVKNVFFRPRYLLAMCIKRIKSQQNRVVYFRFKPPVKAVPHKVFNGSIANYVQCYQKFPDDSEDDGASPNVRTKTYSNMVFCLIKIIFLLDSFLVLLLRKSWI